MKFILMASVSANKDTTSLATAVESVLPLKLMTQPIEYAGLPARPMKSGTLLSVPAVAPLLTI